MTRLSDSLKTSPALRVKTFELAGHTFKVNVPLTAELEEINKRYIEISEEDKQVRLKKMTESLTATEVDGVEVKDNDVFVDGRSVKNTVTSILVMERKIVEYFKLLIPVEGNWDNLTYEEIEAEFPLQVQFELLEKITEAIQPGYKEARKNL
jgi:hypothetical protein